MSIGLLIGTFMSGTIFGFLVSKGFTLMGSEVVWWLHALLVLGMGFSFMGLYYIHYKLFTLSKENES